MNENEQEFLRNERKSTLFPVKAFLHTGGKTFGRKHAALHKGLGRSSVIWVTGS